MRRFSLLLAAVAISVVVSRCDLTPPKNQIEAPAVNFQLDANHTGRLVDPSVTAPFKKLWTVDVGGNVTYPVIVKGNIYAGVTFSESEPQVVALSGDTGKKLWAPVTIKGGGHRVFISYDNKALYARADNGVLVALDPSTGKILWTSEAKPGNADLFAAVGGALYVAGGGDVVAISSATGKVLWSAQAQLPANVTTLPGTSTPLTVVIGAVFVNWGDCATYKFGTNHGEYNWDTWGNCSYIGGPLTTVVAHDLYLGGSSDSAGSGAILDAVNGNKVTNLADPIPADDGKNLYFTEKTQLKAVNINLNQVAWTFKSNQLATLPISVNTMVLVGSTTGTLTALDSKTGAVLWSDASGETFSSWYDNASIAAGDGMVVVPATNKLVAYGSSGESTTSGSADAGTHTDGGTNQADAGASATDGGSGGADAGLNQ